MIYRTDWPKRAHSRDGSWRKYAAQSMRFLVNKLRWHELLSTHKYAVQIKEMGWPLLPLSKLKAMLHKVKMHSNYFICLQPTYSIASPFPIRWVVIILVKSLHFSVIVMKRWKSQNHCNESNEIVKEKYIKIVSQNLKKKVRFREAVSTANCPQTEDLKPGSFVYLCYTLENSY